MDDGDFIRGFQFSLEIDNLLKTMKAKRMTKDSQGPTDKQVIRAIERVRKGEHSRTDLLKLKTNAKLLLSKGNTDAQFLIDEINRTPVTALQKEYVFMGFCPGGDINNRLDSEWMEEGFCKFDFHESLPQLERFRRIHTGDVIILKKREKFGETMQLFGHGVVKKLLETEHSQPQYLRVDWFKPDANIEVPLMGCNSTVDVRSIAEVEKNMPDAFWDWLNSGNLTCPSK